MNASTNFKLHIDIMRKPLLIVNKKTYAFFFAFSIVIDVLLLDAPVNLVVLATYTMSRNVSTFSHIRRASFPVKLADRTLS
jgi:hypothetical protein